METDIGEGYIGLSTEILKPQGTIKPTELKKNDIIIGLDSDQLPQEGIVEVIKRGRRKPCRLINVGDKSLIASLDLQFRTEKGWRRLADLLKHCPRIWTYCDGRAKLEEVKFVSEEIESKVITIQVSGYRNLVASGIVVRSSYLKKGLE